MSFENLNLDSRLLQAIAALNFTQPTDIQREAIPVIMSGRDLMASAQTGTGKTAAFMLPALHRLLTQPAKPGRGPRVLVLTPTRELAQQVTDAVQTFGKDTRLRCGVIVGGVSYFHQERLLSRPCDILVATPGRLMDHMQRGRVDFSRLEMLILDEADRMLDMGFIDDVKLIAEKTPEDRQTLLFSATLEGEIERVASRLLKEPARIQISGVTEKHGSITQFVMAADDYSHKLALIENMLEDGNIFQAVVFVGTKAGTEELAHTLKARGHFADALHGDMRQNVRQRVIDKAHSGKLRILVATDVAARGLDVKGITHVINFDLPMVAEDYVHRIGRTGRAGATGTALSLVSPRDWHKWERIERLTGQAVEEVTVEGLEPRSRRPSRKSSGGRPQRDGRSSGRSFGDNPRRSSSNRPYEGRNERRPDSRSEGRTFEPRSTESRPFEHRSSEPRSSAPRSSAPRSADSRPYEGRSFESRGERRPDSRSEARTGTDAPRAPRARRTYAN